MGAWVHVAVANGRICLDGMAALYRQAALAAAAAGSSGPESCLQQRAAGDAVQLLY